MREGVRPMLAAVNIRLLEPPEITCHSRQEASFPGSRHTWCHLVLLAVETSTSQGRRQEVCGMKMREALSVHGAAETKKGPCRTGLNSKVCGRERQVT